MAVKGLKEAKTALRETKGARSEARTKLNESRSGGTTPAARKEQRENRKALVASKAALGEARTHYQGLAAARKEQLSRPGPARKKAQNEVKAARETRLAARTKRNEGLTGGVSRGERKENRLALEVSREALMAVRAHYQELAAERQKKLAWQAREQMPAAAPVYQSPEMAPPMPLPAVAAAVSPTPIAGEGLRRAMAQYYGANPTPVTATAGAERERVRELMLPVGQGFPPLNPGPSTPAPQGPDEQAQIAAYMQWLATQRGIQ